MSRMLLDSDPVSRTQTYGFVESNGDVVIHTEQDVEDIVEFNKAMFSATDERARYGDRIGPGTHVAKIPMSIYFDLQRRGILDDEKELSRWLNDPDNRAFRTRPGKV